MSRGLIHEFRAQLKQVQRQALHKLDGVCDAWAASYDSRTKFFLQLRVVVMLSKLHTTHKSGLLQSLLAKVFPPSASHYAGNVSRAT
jgi:hypothetical protein